MTGGHIVILKYYFGEGEQCKIINKLHETCHLFIFTAQITFDICYNFRNLLTYAFHFRTPLGLRELDEALRLQTLSTGLPSSVCVVGCAFNGRVGLSN